MSPGEGAVKQREELWANSPPKIGEYGVSARAEGKLVSTMPSVAISRRSLHYPGGGREYERKGTFQMPFPCLHLRQALPKVSYRAVRRFRTELFEGLVGSYTKV